MPGLLVDGMVLNGAVDRQCVRVACVSGIWHWVARDSGSQSQIYTIITMNRE